MARPSVVEFCHWLNIGLMKRILDTHVPMLSPAVIYVAEDLEILEEFIVVAPLQLIKLRIGSLLIRLRKLVDLEGNFGLKRSHLFSIHELFGALPDEKLDWERLDLVFKQLVVCWDLRVSVL